MAVDTGLTVDDELRSALLAHEDGQRLSQNSHAQLLGIGQPKLSEFFAGRRGITITLARAVAAHHPELRPLIHRWAAGQDATE